MAEGLAGFVRKAIEKDLLQSVEIGGRSTKVNMLPYANDIYVFFLQSERTKRVRYQGYSKFL